ncbi:YqgE/AlgH family protein [Asticcacaulis sp. DW145]|uniref:YqgE/AlgH family protein n=1 Tax=unclassified Asticcacaulis TaxID=2628350 RepID=UPI00308DC259|nr:YqgE/AlgH family protein [Asticcacaulis sp. DW145]
MTHIGPDPSDPTASSEDASLQATSLQGRLLVAMPSLDDPNFDHSVIYMCQHDAESAMGIVLTQPIGGLTFPRMMEELGIDITDDRHIATPIYNGGPVQNERGFVLHSLDYFIDEVTLPLDIDPEALELREGVGLTVSRDILVDLARGAGPSRVLIALGYAGWGPGQLEAEIRDNAWLIAPSNADILFSHDAAGLWNRALKSLGILPEHLSLNSGRA